MLIVLTLGLPLSVFLLGRETSFFNKAYFGLFGSKANLTVNLSSQVAVNSYPWSNFSQGGEEKDGMLTEVITEMRLLEPTYIRVDHIYDFYNTVRMKPDGGLEFNWIGLDREISAITQSGAIPFISLSYMPSVISSGSEVDIPKDWSLWKEVVKQTINHISGKNGLAIEGVYYEVWNEPDLFGKFELFGEKNYLMLYKYAAEGAGETQDVYPFKFGGPAVASVNKEWLTGFIDFITRYGVRLDFYSWHKYDKDVNAFEDSMVKIKEWLQNYPDYNDIELIISEYGYDSEVNKDNDEAISAIHNIAGNALLFQKLDKVFHFEVKDGPGDKKYWGRWGILTHEKFGSPVKKPRYESILFLNKLKGNVFPVFGQGTWVKSIATTRDGVIRLLIANYDPNGKHFENVPVHFVKIPYKDFIIRRIGFRGKTVESEVSITSDNWDTSQFMEPNTAVILEIEPK